jgi:murein L,D-transpeptidase YafK
MPRKRTKRVSTVAATGRRIRGSLWFRIAIVVVAISVLLLWYAHAPRGRALPEGGIADRIVVQKELRKLTLMANGRELKTYLVCLGENPEGHKQQEGDERTPEGVYIIDHHNDQSQFHLSLHISYPDENDRARAAAMGVSAGSNIMIHGLPNGLGWLGNLYQLNDWTDGCLAVTDSEIEEIYRAVPNSTPIEIRR